MPFDFSELERLGRDLVNENSDLPPEQIDGLVSFCKILAVFHSNVPIPQN